MSLFDQRMSVELIGPYYGDPNGVGEIQESPCGWPDLEIGYIKHGRAAPYLICHYGTPIGWSPLSSLLRK
jgi:hypothetical protein